MSTESTQWPIYADPERVAQLIAHRACCGTEHDPANGKLHGYCVVCGVDWPCEYAGKPPLAAAPAAPSLMASAEVAASHTDANLIGYRDAWYEICTLLDIPAMAMSPKQVHDSVLMPKLRQLVTDRERKIGSTEAETPACPTNSGTNDAKNARPL
jgi:hypothetical protein